MSNPSIELGFNGGKHELTPENSTLFLHRLGSTAIDGVDYDNQRFDHAFYVPDPEVRSGVAIFREQMGEGFDTVAEAMEENGYTTIKNIQEPSEADRLIYIAHLESMAETAAESLDDELNELLGNGEE